MNKGYKHELEFWKRFTTTARFKNNWENPIPNPECQPETRAIIEAEIEGRKKYRVLDLGSGVVSILYGIVPIQNLFSCDPLADKYAEIYDYGHTGAPKPDQGYGENLPYPDNHFHIVHISNAIDHTENPARVIAEMERVCKKDGVIIIAGMTDEGEKEGYEGLHQFNAHIIDGINGKAFEIVDKAGQVIAVIDPGYNGEPIFADTKRLETGRDYFIFSYRKW